jgi:hypothetical protein
MEAVDPTGWPEVIEALGPSAFVLLVLAVLMVPTLLRMLAERRRPAEPQGPDLTDIRESLADLRKRVAALERRMNERKDH